MNTLISLVERGWIPDALTRIGIRRLLATRLNEAAEQNRKQGVEEFVKELKNSPIAVHTERANEQHYEVPTAFFVEVLGPRMKYSSCYWPAGIDTLEQAEEAMLELTCERAQLADGMDILELGCGWGSLSIWMAERYPNSRITAVSNSATQKQYIDDTCRRKGLTNLTVITSDMNDFDTKESFDRVMSVEMFEHMRNYEELLRRIARWTKPDAKLFVHIFCHKTFAYAFETEEADDWMGRYFFTGGIMPSENLLSYFQDDFRLREQWPVNGNHYARTLRAWLDLQDEKKEAVMPILARTYGADQATVWFNRWRIFFMACEELFGYSHGTEWYVTHYLFDRRTGGA